MDIVNLLEAQASTVHGGAYAAMMAGVKEIKRLRSIIDRAKAEAELMHCDDDSVKVVLPYWFMQTNLIETEKPKKSPSLG